MCSSRQKMECCFSSVAKFLLCNVSTKFCRFPCFVPHVAMHATSRHAHHEGTKSPEKKSISSLPHRMSIAPSYIFCFPSQGLPVSPSVPRGRRRQEVPLRPGLQRRRRIRGRGILFPPPPLVAFVPQGGESAFPCPVLLRRG